MPANYQLAFIGLGLMGAPMARRLVNAGHRTAVYNRNAAKADELASVGAIAKASAADAVADARVVGLCLSDDEAVDEVLTGPHGVLAGAQPGVTVLDHSTIAPTTAKRMAAAAAEAGVTYLDAPVSGGVAGAEAGTLTVTLGGTPTEVVTEILKVIAGRVLVAGPVGSGSAAKLAHNLVSGVLLTGVAEALVMAEQYGLDADLVREMFAAGPLASPILEWYVSEMVHPTGTVRFPLGHRAKDCILAEELADAVGVHAPHATTARAVVSHAAAALGAEVDTTAVVHCYRDTEDCARRVRAIGRPTLESRT